MSERIEVKFCGEYGCRVVKLSVDSEGKVRVLEGTRVDSRQSDDPPLADGQKCPECGGELIGLLRQTLEIFEGSEHYFPGTDRLFLCNECDCEIPID